MNAESSGSNTNDNSIQGTPTPTQNTNLTTSGAISKEGILEKKGDVNKTWRVRYFSLQNKELTYFVDKTKSKKKGSIDLEEMSEIGVLAHETRPFCFGFTTGKRLWVLSADSAEVRDSWLNVLRSFQSKTLEAGTKVPHTTIGSFKKTIKKAIGSKSENDNSVTSTSPTDSSTATSSSTTSSNSTSNNNTSNTQTSSSPTSTNNSPSQQLSSSGNNVTPSSTIISTNSTSPPSSSSHPINISAPSNNGSSAPIGSPRSSNIASSPPNSTMSNLQTSVSPPSSRPVSSINLPLSGGGGALLPVCSPPLSPTTNRSTTMMAIQSNEPRATIIVPTSAPTWNPKFAWTPSVERPAWCYEMAPPGSPQELTAWLAPLLSAATRFNIGWAFILDWVRRIGNPSYPNSTILENIKQGLVKLQPCWGEFDKALNLAEAWDASHFAVNKLRDQIKELHTLTDTKVSSWHVQLAPKLSFEESAFELTYKRQDSGLPERPAWFLQPTDSSTAVAEAFKILERAATVFNNGWSIAYELSKSFTETNKSGAPLVKGKLTDALAIIEASWKDFDAAIAAFESWNAVSLYTLEVKQHVGQLKRLYENNKKNWIQTLDSRQTFEPTNKYEYPFEIDKSPTPERPAWFFKFSLSTPSDLSRGLVALSMAANVFNSNWATALEWASKIGKKVAARAAIREGITEAFAKLDASAWTEFESALALLEPWQSATTQVISQISVLKNLVEASREDWLGRLATSTEMPPLNSIQTRLSSFGESELTTMPSARESIVSTIELTPYPRASIMADDASVMFENAMAAVREALSISDQPDAVLSFIPGLGPGTFKTTNIYPLVLKDLYKAQQMPNTSSELLEKIRELIVSIQLQHKELCFKWALYYAREGNLPRSIEYYEALYEVLPDAVVQLDKELASLKAEFEASGTLSQEPISFSSVK